MFFVCLFVCLFAMIAAANEQAEPAGASNEIQPSHAIFPPSISSAVMALIDLLYDNSLNSQNQSS